MVECRRRLALELLYFSLFVCCCFFFFNIFWNQWPLWLWRSFQLWMKLVWKWRNWWKEAPPFGENVGRWRNVMKTRKVSWKNFPSLTTKYCPKNSSLRFDYVCTYACMYVCMYPTWSVLLCTGTSEASRGRPVKWKRPPTTTLRVQEVETEQRKWLLFLRTVRRASIPPIPALTPSPSLALCWSSAKLWMATNTKRADAFFGHCGPAVLKGRLPTTTTPTSTPTPATASAPWSDVTLRRHYPHHCASLPLRTGNHFWQPWPSNLIGPVTPWPPSPIPHSSHSNGAQAPSTPLETNLWTTLLILASCFLSLRSLHCFSLPPATHLLSIVPLYNISMFWKKKKKLYCVN